MNNGYIQLHRKLLENPIFMKAELLQLFIYCLLKANHKPEKFIWNGSEITIERGQFITGRIAMAKDLNQSESATYKRLQLLNKLKIITLKSNNKFTLLSVCKYDIYQATKNQKEQQRNNKVTTKEQQSNTNNNDNNDNNDNKRDIPDSCESVLIKPAKKDILKNCFPGAVKIFMEFYERKSGVKYSFTGKDGKHLKLILARLWDFDKTENGILQRWEFLLENLNDNWVIENLSVPVINSKFNEILNKIKNHDKFREANNKRGFVNDTDKWQSILEYARAGAGGESAGAIFSSQERENPEGNILALDRQVFRNGTDFGAD